MRKIKYNIGETYGKWKVIGEPIRKNNTTFVPCICQCEKQTKRLVDANSLRRGTSKSCGCIGREKTIKRNKEGTGKPKNSLRKYNKYDLESKEYGVCYFNNSDKYFIFDKEDYDKIKKFTWYESNGYAMTKGNVDCSINTQAHKIIMDDIQNNFIIDHINRDRLDNRKENLRQVNYNENAWNSTIKSNNTTGIIGVWIDKRCTKHPYKAEIKYNNKKIFLGCFSSMEEAIKTRLEAEYQYFGKEFAPQRNLFEKYDVNFE